jgi:hypothetical protein
MIELQGLIGLGKVKQDVAKLVDYLKLEQMRRSSGEKLLT